MTDATTASAAIVRPAGSGESIPLGFAPPHPTVQVRLAAGDGAGLGIVEYEAPPGYAPPPVLHRHTREAFGIYVLAGAVGVAFEDREVTVAAGGLVWVPRGTWFRWWVAGDQPVRWLGMFLPGGFEGFFAATRDAARSAAATGGRAAVMAALQNVKAQYGDEMLTAPAVSR
jgi:mannose-6-phosphate isomerase-like protein (cupin superfamily)